MFTLSVAVAHEKKCWCRPALMVDWLAALPEYGVGLLVTQFQKSPPSEPPTAPVGSPSSTQTVLLVVTMLSAVGVSGRTALVDAPVLVGRMAGASFDLCSRPVGVDGITMAGS